MYKQNQLHLPLWHGWTHSNRECLLTLSCAGMLEAWPASSAKSEHAGAMQKLGKLQLMVYVSSSR